MDTYNNLKAALYSMYEVFSENLKRFDVIILHSPFPALVFRELDKPILIYNHTAVRDWTFTFEENLEYFQPLMRMYQIKHRNTIIKLAKEGYESADLVVTNSYFTKQMLKKYFDIDARVIYPPLDLNKFKPIGDDREEYFLSVQRIDNYAKRVHLQIEAFKRMPDKELIIIGDGKQANILEDVVDDIPNITYLGKVPDKALVSFYSKAQAVIQTALKEDFGLVPVEAMACGTPVICVNEGGFRETVNETNGILIDKPYVENLIRAVRSWDPKRYDRNKIRDSVRHLSLERYQAEMKQAINDAIQIHYSRKS